MEIKQAIEIYLNWKKAYTNVAYSRYKVRLVKFSQFIGTTKSIRDINGDDIVNYHNSMEENYSLGTVAYSARILKNFFEFWKGREPHLLNPKEIIPIRYTAADKELVTQLDFEDMNLALDESTVQGLTQKLVINLLWDTGMRVSELCELKLKDIGEAKQNGLRTAKVRSRKSMRYNLVVWGTETNRLLNLYLGNRVFFESISENLLINPKSSKGYTTRTIQRWMKEICKLADIEKSISPHCLRHSKAHAILDAGGNVRDVQALLRHVKPESSFNYLSLNPTKYLEVAGKYLVS